MVGFIGGIAMFVAALVIATRGLGLMIKCINVLFNEISDGLEERLNSRKRRRLN